MAQRFRPFFGIVAALLVLASCKDNESDQHQENEPERQSSAQDEGIALTAEQIDNAGISSVAIEAMTYLPEARGYAVVIAHDAIAQSLSDVVTAAAAARQSQAALARVQGLAQTPGAFSAETLESAQHQAQSDEAALNLARRKLSASWGEHSPWASDERNELLAKAASGKVQLVRATFSYGVLEREVPTKLRFTELDHRQPATNLLSTSVWDAPADASIPGRSVFALLNRAPLSEGERLEAWAPAGEQLNGTLVPSSAVVVYNGASWCYVEDRPAHFSRRSVDVQRPVEHGYFEDSQFQADEKVVVTGATFLLARELNPSTEAEE